MRRKYNMKKGIEWQQAVLFKSIIIWNQHLCRKSCIRVFGLPSIQISNTWDFDEARPKSDEFSLTWKINPCSLLKVQVSMEI